MALSSSSVAAAREAASTRRSDRPLRGIALMVAAMLLIPVMDGIAKHLSGSYAVGQVVWARYFFHLAILLPFVLWRYGAAAFRPRRLGLQLARGGLLLASTVLFFTAIALIPLADATALVFISPLVVTALSPLILGEHVGPRRWSAVIVGFIGACIIVRPGLGLLDWGGLLALAAGTTYAFYSLSTRKLAGSAPPVVTLTFTALLGAIVTSLAMPWFWSMPSLPDLLLMAILGVIAAAGHLLIIRAFEEAPASLLAPYGYTEIVMATTIGYLVFGDFPDAWTWIGIAVVIASGVYISLRERRLHRQ